MLLEIETMAMIKGTNHRTLEELAARVVGLCIYP
jgi:hypothetical protein